MKVYTENLIAVLTQLGISIPDNISMDQKQITRMIASIETALDTYDPAPPGDALVTDVVAGKIFSTAAALGLVGTLEFTQLPAPQVLVMGNLTAVVEGAPWYTGLFDAIEFYDGDATKLGDATYVEGSGWTFDLAGYLVAGGAYTVEAKYTAAPATTLADSLFDTVTLTAYDITRALTGCVDTNVQVVALDEQGFSGQLTLLENFTTLPAVITVTAGAVPLVEDTDYTYNELTGEYSILGAAVVGDIVITAVATA